MRVRERAAKVSMGDRVQRGLTRAENPGETKGGGGGGAADNGVEK